MRTTEKTTTDGTVAAPAGGRFAGDRRLAVALRVVLLVLLVVAVLEVQSAATYRVPGGTVSFSIRAAWPGGRLVMPLGPAGEFALHTHRTPLDIVMDYRLPAQTSELTGEGGAVEELPSLRANAREAFDRFLLSRIPWLLLAGACGGALVLSFSARRRALLTGAAAGLVAVTALSGAVAVLTLVTVDRTPAAEYSGLARNVTKVLPLLRSLSSGGSEGAGRLQDFVAGLESVATQLETGPEQPKRDSVVRLLLVSDVHDNLFGMRAASKLAAADGEPVDGVLVAGDVTDLGTAAEARLFVRAFNAAGAPVVFVGGNHEAEPSMRVLRRAGYRVLDVSSATIDGVEVFGASDPMAFSAQVDSDDGALRLAAEQLAARWGELKPAPQVLLVHDLTQAADVTAAAKDAGQAVVVAYGNDHVAGVRRDGSLVEVDAGTAGASGYEQIGSGHGERYTFQLLDFARTGDHALAGVTSLSYGTDGRTTVAYTPFNDTAAGGKTVQ